MNIPTRQNKKQDKKGIIMKTKIITSVALLLILCGISTYYIVWGKRGVNTFKTISKEIDQEKEKVKKVEDEIKHLKTIIALWQTDEFELEKLARMDLQMGTTNEIVYLLPKKSK